MARGAYAIIEIPAIPLVAGVEQVYIRRIRGRKNSIRRPRRPAPPSDNSRNSAFAAMKACSSSGDISTPKLSACLAQLLNRLDTRGALHHLLLGCRHDDYPFLVRPRVATGVCESVWEPLLPSASRRERTTDYSERTLVHGAERSRADGREGAFISLKEKRADASSAKRAYRSMPRRGRRNQSKDRVALQWWQALQLPRQ